MFDRFKSKFFMGSPTVDATFSIYNGAWKYDFDEKSPNSIYKQIDTDPRPRWCAEVFGSLEGRSVVELGPADGYHTAALERLGAQVTAIEGNVDAFLRCLILKNALNLKAQFLIGDFTKAFGPGAAKRWDVVYACGILYHLLDPVQFIFDCAKSTDNLFLWTHYFDEKAAEGIDFEARGFAAKVKKVVSRYGKTYTYFEKSYDLGHVELMGYIGGLNATASWLSRDDLLAAVSAAGFRIEKLVEDPLVEGIRMPALNILAKKWTAIR